MLVVNTPKNTYAHMNVLNAHTLVHNHSKISSIYSVIPLVIHPIIMGAMPYEHNIMVGAVLSYRA